MKLEARSWKQNQCGLRAEHTTTGAGVTAKRVWVGVSFKLEARSWKQNQRGLRAEHTTTGTGVRAKRVWVELALSWKLEAGSLKRVLPRYCGHS